MTKLVPRKKQNRGRCSELSLLGQLNYDDLGLDISRYVRENGEKINSLQEDAHINCFDTLEHLKRPDLLVKESYRCLRSEGVFTAQNPITNPIDYVSDKLHKMDEIHPSLLTYNEIIFAVKKAGFHTTQKGLLRIPFQRFTLFGRFFEIGVLTSVARRIVILAVKTKLTKTTESKPAMRDTFRQERGYA